MVFASLFFLCIFFPICMLLYYLMPSIKWRNAVLLIFSLIFYSWGEPKYIFLMVTTVLLNYVFGLLIDVTRGKWSSKIFLVLALISSLGALGFFKYSGFLSETITSISHGIGDLISGIPYLGKAAVAMSGFDMTALIPKVSLPIGISFYTFQILSYIIDVYRGNVKSQKSPFKLLLYISCFHQLIAGPIVRYDHIAAEIDERNTTPAEIWEGIRRFVIGLSKKVIIANLCGEVAGSILDGDLSSLTVTSSWFGIVMFSIQIFFDFSAYSDMAIGMGRMCGFHYHENFDYPYVSRSISEFWRRWHISLGSFFRDYVYIPLGGNRRHQLFNLFVVWMLTGLWHGASWNFVVWGLYYFVFIALEKFVYGKILKKLYVLNNIYTLFIVVIGWVFFYYTDFSKAIGLLKAMFGFAGNGFTDIVSDTQIINNIYLFALGIICCIPFIPMAKKLVFKSVKTETPASPTGTVLQNTGFILSAVIVFALLAVSIIVLVGDSYNPFLYFRF